MSVLKSYVTSGVLQRFFVIASSAALLSIPSVALSQLKSASIENSGASRQTVGVPGITLGGEAWIDGAPLRKNLRIENPGFEPADYRAILRCGAMTPDGCRVTDAAMAEQSGFWNGARYHVMSGGAAGAVGTVVSHTSGDDGQVLALDKSLNLSGGDYLSVEILKTPNGAAGWTSSVDGGGTITAETSDLYPETSGKQALLLSTLGRGESVRLSQELDAQPDRNKLQLNGAYELTFRAKGLAGNNQLDVTLAREAGGSAAYLNRPVALSDSWAQYTLSFSASETGMQLAPLQLGFAAAGANIELDDVSLQQSNSNPANATTFRDEVVNALQDLHPGSIRMVSGGSDVLVQLQSPFASFSPSLGSSNLNSAQNMAPGVQELLQLCEKIGADPWITVSAATTPTKMTALVQYLTGDGSDPWSALRIAGGHVEPWTSDFRKIHIELDNATGSSGICERTYVSISLCWLERRGIRSSSSKQRLFSEQI